MLAVAPRAQEALFDTGGDAEGEDRAAVKELRVRVCAVVRAHFERCAGSPRGRPGWPNAWLQHCAVVRSLLQAGYDDADVGEALWRARGVNVTDVELCLGVLPVRGWRPERLGRRLGRTKRSDRRWNPEDLSETG